MLPISSMIARAIKRYGAEDHRVLMLKLMYISLSKDGKYTYKDIVDYYYKEILKKTVDKK